MSKLIVISGPSGAGKGTVVRELLKIYQEHNDKVHLSISVTTRSKRDYEEEGVHYYFIPETEFLEKIAMNEFLEYNIYGTGKYYGTLKSHVYEYLEKGYDVILEIDVNGYKQVLKNEKDAVGIFIMPPSLQVLEERLRNRKTETEEQIKKRLKTAKEELKDTKFYPHIVINQDGLASVAANEVYEIIKKESYGK